MGFDNLHIGLLVFQLAEAQLPSGNNDEKLNNISKNMCPIICLKPGENLWIRISLLGIFGEGWGIESGRGQDAWGTCR